MTAARRRAAAIQHLIPGAEFSLVGDAIEWLDERPQPSQEEIAAACVEIARSEAHASLLSLCGAVEARLLNAYPAGERLSWELKTRAAEKVDAEETLNASEQTLMDGEIAATGESSEAWAQAVLAKLTPFAALAGAIAGIRRASVDAIGAAEDEAAIDAILAQAETDLEVAWGVFEGV